MSMELAEQFEENGQYEEAYAEYKKSLEHSPNDLSLLAQLGHISVMLGKKEEAEGFYHKMLSLDATNPTAYEQLMDIYLDTDKYKYYVYRGNYHSTQQQYEHALHDFQKAIPHAGDEHEAVASVRFVMGTLYEQLGNTTKAIDEYLKVLDYSDHKNAEVYVRLANMYLKEDVLGSAIETLERAISDGFDLDDIRESLATLYLKNNTPEKVKNVSKNELTLIKAMLGCGELDEAKQELDRVADKYKDNPQIHSLYAEYYYSSKDYEKALESVTKFAKAVPNNPLIFQMSALIHEALGDEYKATLNWAKLHLVKGQKDIAINELLSAYQLNDSDADMVAMLANLLETSGEKHQAMEFYERLVELEPNNKTAMMKIAEYWEGNGDNRLAVEYLEKLLQADPRNFPMMKKAAELHQKLKNKGSAVDWYNKYLQSAPQSDEYEVVKNKLAKLEHSEMTPDEESEGLIDKIFNFFNRSKV